VQAFPLVKKKRNSSHYPFSLVPASLYAVKSLSSPHTMMRVANE